MAHVESVARLLVLLAGLLGPGVALLWALRLPLSVAGAFAGSAVALSASVLVLTTTGVPLRFTTLAASLGVLSAAALATKA